MNIKLYLIALIAAYFSCKYLCKASNEAWTRKERLIGLGLALLPYLNICPIVYAVYLFLYRVAIRFKGEDYWNKPAKW